MEKSVGVLQGTPLFAGFSAAEIEKALQMLGAVRRRHKKGETLLLAGFENNEIGIVVSGQIEALKETQSGRQFIVSQHGPGGVYGDILAGGHNKSPVTVRAGTTAETVSFSYPLLLSPSSGGNPLTQRLLANLTAVLSAKYFALDARLELLLIHGLRPRLAAYLLGQQKQAGSPRFTTPYNRAALAAYLGCERSALSRAISGFAKEGLIYTKGAYFSILQPERLADLL